MCKENLNDVYKVYAEKFVRAMDNGHFALAEAYKRKIIQLAFEEGLIKFNWQTDCVEPHQS